MRLFSGVPTHLKRLRSRKRAARRWSVLAGLFGGVSAVAVPLGGLTAVDAVWTGLFGASAIFAAFRWSDYRALAKASPQDQQRLNEVGVGALTMEAHAVAGQLAGKFRKGRLGAQFRRSAAGPGYSRLADCAAALDQIEPQLPEHARETVEQAHGAARELKSLAERIRGMEQTLDVTPPHRRSALEESHAAMVDQFNAGVSAYEELVAACAEVLGQHSALTGSGHSGADLTMTQLDDATMRLRGFADAIAEMRQHRSPG
ncbi:phage shock envelope stress response protein PspM [Stackebrandtia soli]|uniref:phage shock envelope stress response protein PspM n=1 Tax=Stackebrandtia soli TaxID=1892856 RepID=UPI0039E79779